MRCKCSDKRLKRLARKALLAIEDPQAHHQEHRQPKGINMLACEIAALFPQEWELARQKYNRDLDDLTRLFTGQAPTH